MQVFQNSSFSWKAQILFIYLFFNKKFFFKVQEDFIIYLFIYFWLHQVLVAVRGIFIAACRSFRCGARTSLQLQCAAFSLVVVCRFSLLQLWQAGSRTPGLCSFGTQVPERVGSVVCDARALQLWHAGLVAPRHVGSQFPNQGSNPSPLHWKVDSLPLNHRGSPLNFIIDNECCQLPSLT